MNKNTGKNEELFVRRSAETFCIICQKRVELLTFQQAAEILKTDAESIYRLTQKTELHLLHNRKGVVMICGKAARSIVNRREMMISNPRIIVLKPLTK